MKPLFAAVIFSTALLTAASPVLLDGYHNNETKDPDHYRWENTKSGGFSELERLVRSLGGEARTLRQPVTLASLGDARVFVIVDPDTPTESEHPKYIETSENLALEQWVRAGGRLVLLANDKGSAEFAHLNKLAGKFGIEFLETTHKNAKGEDHITVSGPDALHAYLVSAAPLKLVNPNAKVWLEDAGTPLAAMVPHGKGFVFAIGDPWLYNEYIDRANNRQLAETVFRTLIASNVPRSEYPEPQFMRSLWTTLNGAWEFAFDDKNEGLSQHWNSGVKPFPKKITVPYCFESKLSGIGDTGFHAVVWYRRQFTAPAAWKGKNLSLHFGAVDYRARVWVNGELLGSHEGGNVPFAFDITSAMHAGANTVVVRAEDPPEDKSIPRGKQYWKQESEGIFYTRTSGIWQPVWLEASGGSYLERVHVVAGQDGVAHFEGQLALAASDQLEYRIAIMDGTGEVGSAAGKIALNRFSANVTLAQAKLWSPDAPNLYSVKYQVLSSGKIVDEVDSYIGFRTIAVAHDRVTVNGKPVYLKLLLDQGYWPESILTPPSEDAILHDIDLMVAMGFNGARKHQKVEDPRFLYQATGAAFWSPAKLRTCKSSLRKPRNASRASGWRR